jgi:hypothetical protein
MEKKCPVGPPTTGSSSLERVCRKECGLQITLHYVVYVGLLLVNYKLKVKKETRFRLL